MIVLVVKHIRTGVTPAPPTLPPFSFSCVLVFLTQQVSVTCESSRDLASLQYDCQLNGADLTEGCESQLMADCYNNYDVFVI